MKLQSSQVTGVQHPLPLCLYLLMVCHMYIQEGPQQLKNSGQRCSYDSKVWIEVKTDEAEVAKHMPNSFCICMCLRIHNATVAYTHSVKPNW